MLMECGHISNAELNGEPACVICECTTPAEVQMNLEGRTARCSTCGRITNSRETLAFFEYRPDREMDSYYCGCYGWD